MGAGKGKLKGKMLNKSNIENYSYIECPDINVESKRGYLGNQLFVYAAMLAYALEHKNHLNLREWRYYHIFKHKPNFLTHSYNENLKIEYYEEPTFTYTPIPKIKHQGTVLKISGYFQSYKYFDEWKQYIKFLFTPSEMIKKSILQYKSSDLKFLNYDDLITYARVCSVHFRFGDYLNFPHVFTNLSQTDYYERAFEMIKGDIDYFLVFSNDIPKTREYLKKFNYKFIFVDSPMERQQGNDAAIFDMFLGSFCNHNIIANSSFSFWQSYLNDSPYKKVIAPKNWFMPKSGLVSTDICSPDFILI